MASATRIMEFSIALRILGSLLIIAGVVLAYNPEIVSNSPVPEDTFAAIERRIWWGLLIGAGILIIFHQQLLPWQMTLAAGVSAILFGLLIARLIGIAIDGSVLRQWINVGIEVVIMAPFLWWYFKLRA